MKTMLYDGKLFWVVTDTSAVRAQDNGRLGILTWHDGEIKDITRTVKPDLYAAVKQLKEATL